MQEAMQNPPMSVPSNSPKARLDAKKILIVVFVLIFVLFLWQWVSSPLIVAVSGVGEVSVPATSATVTATLSVNAGSVQDAVVSINAKAGDLKTILLSNGVSEEDISISQITTYPASLISTTGTGYQSSLQISAKTTDVPGISGLVADLYSMGATIVSQPVLNVENQKDLEAKATEEALNDAKSQIAVLAKRNAKLFRKMVVLNEQTTSTTSDSSSKADEKTIAESELAAENGVFKIGKVVTVQYKLW
jgi:uncharacterized protein YggE